MKIVVIILISFLLISTTLFSSPALNLLPAECNGFFSINFKEIMNSEVVQFISNHPQAGQELKKGLDKFRAKTGFDFSALETINAGLIINEENRNKPVFFVTANLSNPDVVNAIQLIGRFISGEPVNEEFGEISLLKLDLPEKFKNFRTAYLYQAGNTLALSPDGAKLASLISGKGKSLKDNSKLFNLAEKGVKFPLYYSFVLNQKLKDRIAQQPMAAAFAKLDSVSMGIKSENGLQVHLFGSTPDNQTAGELSGMLNGFKMMGAGFAAKKPEIGDFLNNLTVSSDASDVVIQLNLNKEMLQNLIEKSIRKQAEKMMETQLKTETEESVKEEK